MKGLFKRLAIFMPLVFLLSLTNYIVDPANVFKANDYEKSMVDIMLTGKNIANISNYKERIFQDYYIAASDEKKDIIMLGSSKSLQIGSDLFTRKSFFNHSVSGATLQDYMAILEMYIEKNKPPDEVIIELSPWILNANNKQNRWENIRDYYYNFKKRLRTGAMPRIFSADKYAWAFRVKKYLQLFSLSYFQGSVEYVLYMIRNKDFQQDFYPTDLTESNVTVKCSDGHIVYYRDFRLTKPAKALENAKKYISRGPVYGLGGFDKLDEGLKAQLEQFIDFLLSNKVKVVLFMPPHHPYVYGYLINSESYDIIADEESYYRGLADKRGITVLGSYDPSLCGLDGNDFYDGVHLRNEAVERLFKARQIRQFK